MAQNTTKKILPKDNESNIPNPNKGTRGTNKQYSQNQGNRGKQLNPNQEKLKTIKEAPNMAKSKPNPAPTPNRTPKPKPAPKPNPNYPSTTGNPSGKHRGNVKKNS